MSGTRVESKSSLLSHARVAHASSHAFNAVMHYFSTSGGHSIAFHVALRQAALHSNKQALRTCRARGNLRMKWVQSGLKLPPVPSHLFDMQGDSQTEQCLRLYSRQSGWTETHTAMVSGFDLTWVCLSTSHGSPLLLSKHFAQ